MTENVRISATTYRELTGVGTALMRALQSVGVIAPLVSDRGHRLFAQSDVDATLKWLEERAAEIAARQRVRKPPDRKTAKRK